MAASTSGQHLGGVGASPLEEEDPILHKTAGKAPELTKERKNQRMATKRSEWQAPKPKKSVMQWLLDSDPSIRWQVMRDLTEEPDEVVAAERSRVVSEGWGARLLDLQGPEGKWGSGASTPKWEPTLYTLLLLRDMGLDPTSEPARTAVGLVRDKVTWGPEFSDAPFFEGEVEPCVSTPGRRSAAAGSDTPPRQPAEMRGVSARPALVANVLPQEERFQPPLAPVDILHAAPLEPQAQWPDILRADHLRVVPASRRFRR